MHRNDLAQIFLNRVCISMDAKINDRISRWKPLQNSCNVRSNATEKASCMCLAMYIRAGFIRGASYRLIRDCTGSYAGTL